MVLVWVRLHCPTNADLTGKVLTWAQIFLGDIPVNKLLANYNALASVELPVVVQSLDLVHWAIVAYLLIPEVLISRIVLTKSNAGKSLDRLLL